MQLTVGALRKAMEGVRDDVPVLFQGNVHNEDDVLESEPSYTTCIGYVYSSFRRKGETGAEFVLDCAITEEEQ